MPWATREDIEDIYEGEVPDRADGLLANAITLLKHMFRSADPGLDARMLLPSNEPRYLDPQLLKMVIVQAVIRVLRNPKGRSWEREGDYSYGMPIGLPNDTGSKLGGVWFTEDEIALLQPAEGKPSRVGTISMAPPIRCLPSSRPLGRPR